MSGPCIVVSSITYAYKGRDALERRGCGAYIEKAPHELSSCGCHYCIRVKNCPLEKAVDILRKANVKIIETSGGNHDLS